MSDIRDTYRAWSDVPPQVQRAVEAYDAARRSGTSERPMSERNKMSIAPMIEAALRADKPRPVDVGCARSAAEAFMAAYDGPCVWPLLDEQERQRLTRAVQAAFQSLAEESR